VSPGGDTVRRLKRLLNVPDSTRFSKTMGRVQLVLSSWKTENILKQRMRLEKLLRVHSPGSKIILEPFGGWDGLELEFPKWNVSCGDWAVSRRVVSFNKLKWPIFSFQPYKSPGIEGIMLQQGFELLVGKLLVLLRDSLALGYIPTSWRNIRVVFIPKPGQPLSQTKSLRPISLMSFILKTLEKLIISFQQMH
jgi:hypothetical protein